MCSISRADSAPGRIVRERILRRQYAQLRDHAYARGRGRAIGRTRPPAAATRAATPARADARQCPARTDASHSREIPEGTSGQPAGNAAHARTHACGASADNAAGRRSFGIEERANAAAHGAGSRPADEFPWHRRTAPEAHAQANHAPPRSDAAATGTDGDASAAATCDADDAAWTRDGDARFAAAGTTATGRRRVSWGLGAVRRPAPATTTSSSTYCSPASSPASASRGRFQSSPASSP